MDTLQNLLAMCRPRGGAGPCPFDGLGCIDNRNCILPAGATSWDAVRCAKDQKAKRRPEGAGE